MRYIYDIEIFKNLFLVIFHDTKTNTRSVFEISQRQDQRRELFQFLATKPELVGYNNLHFDYPLLYRFLVASKNKIKGRDLVMQLKSLANRIVQGTTPRTPVLLPQIDLMKIKHYDPHGAKATSLKMLQFVLRMENIQELPYPHDALLTVEQIEQVVAYCHNDIDATLQFYYKCQSDIALREELMQKFPFVNMNYNDVKIGEQIIVNKLKEELDTPHLGQTYRQEIAFTNIIFPYIQFKSAELSLFLSWLKTQIVQETKGAFTELPVTQVADILELLDISKENLKRKKKKVVITTPADLLEYPEIQIKTLAITYRDVVFTFGTGGLHQSVKNEIVESTDTHIIKSCDVASMYPNIAIKNKLSPQHLGKTFYNVYNQIYQERTQHPKGSTINAAYKLALNGSYGKTNSAHSELYDPQFTMSITLNGQLLLCMLAEELMTIPDSRLLISNTDGLEILIPRQYNELYHQICHDWEQLTKLTLEYVDYQRLIIANVNNYIGVYTNGKVKLKGAYEIERDFHKNHSMLVVPKAVKAYYTQNISIETFIREHADIYDFFLLTRIQGRQSRLVLRYEDHDEPMQKITRYLITKEGGTLIKILPPLLGKVKDRETNLQKDWLVTVCNDLRQVDLQQLRTQINYDYYINKATKLLQGYEDTESDSE